MAVVKPFRAVRPRKELAEQVAALPYDVYNRSEACEAVQNRPLLFLNIDRAETQFDETVDIYADCVYEKARDMLRAEIADGTFETEDTNCYYIYELTMDGRRQTGLVACSSVDEYLDGTICRHENTRAEKEADRIRHVDTTGAQTGPIFLAYRNVQEISETLRRIQETEPPLYRFVSEDGITHTVWRIAQAETVANIQGLFQERVPNTYIADGHHRAASAVKVGLKRREAHPDYRGDEEFNTFLSVLFPDDQLMIMPYNRVVQDLNGLSEEAFLTAAAEHFVIEAAESAVAPDEKGVFGMLLGNQWYRLTIRERDRSDDPVEGLDVSLLQNYLLAPVLGIDDPKTSRRIDFIGGIRGLGELERRVHTDMAVAFSMYPTSIAELFAVADAGRLMPPKSTWFEPKLRSGLFLHMLED